MQITLGKHWTEVGDTYGRVRGRIEGTEEHGNHAGREIVSNNLEPWELPEGEPQRKSIHSLTL